MNRLLLALLVALAVSFMPFGDLLAQVRSQSNSQVNIFNPSKVDWWVSMDDSILNGRQSCEVHWLYDDSLDVALVMSDDRNLFFTFRISPKNRSIIPPLNLRTNMDKKAVLDIGGARHPLGVEDINLPPVTVIMALSNALNNIDYVQEANRLLLNLDNVVYNFPLENMDENITYFKQCLNKLGVQSSVLPSVPQVSAETAISRGHYPSDQSYIPPTTGQIVAEPAAPVVPSPQPRQSIYGQEYRAPVSYGAPPAVNNIYETTPSPAPYQSIYAQDNSVVTPVYAAPVVNNNYTVAVAEPSHNEAGRVLEYEKIVPPPVIKAPIVPAPIPEETVKKLSKQTDDILDDARYDGMGDIHSENSRENNTSSSSSCDGDVYDAQGTAILRNLLKKLKLLEREKEELRGRLNAFSSNGRIPQILECNTESLEEENSINDDIIAKFEITINSLRAENEILKDALEQAEGQDGQEEKIRQLEKQLSDLVKQNHKLQNDLFKYQLKSSDAEEEEDVFEQDSDAFDDLIERNLSDIVPNNPETIGEDLISSP